MTDEEKRSDEDKRSNDRLTINKEFESFDAFIQEYITNISRTGVFIKSATPLAVGTSVNLRFTVIMDDIETVEGLGEVVRVHDDPPGMGVVFTEISSYSKDLIDKLLTKRLERDGARPSSRAATGGTSGGAAGSEPPAKS